MFSPMEQPSGTATGLMHAFGQRFPQGNEYLPFTDTFNITDLVKTKFDIVPTTFLSQHLVVEGNVVKIFELSTISDLALTVYDQNRVARMLQLSSLGNEVIASLAQLVDGHGLQEQGEKLGFISYDAKNKGRRLVGSMLLTHFIHNHKTVKPNLLAGRLVHLNNLVKRRKRWWVSLGYNIAQQKSDQPFIFAVTILGILFGVSSIVQTVFSA
ncbi:hypothetical protein BD779DRAFT_155111 [Infundibulicybe gibba]|nr:hypothetical protein BD779DRAFT_155111 [Infundibulicybe gibba]